MKPRQKDETDEHYIRRLEASNADLRAQGKWAERVGRAVTWLAVDASLAFQAMAEKAGVRSHPSVTAAVSAFDAIAHPQWKGDDTVISFPTDWDLSPCDEWSGDADMELNAGIAAVIEYLDGVRFRPAVKKSEFEHIINLVAGLERPLQGILDKVIPDRAERKPINIPDDASRDDLARAINEISWRALDLAQDMSFANEALRRDLRAASYRAICGELYQLANLCAPERNPNFDIKVLGGEDPF